jgi:hypothetical protein
VSGAATTYFRESSIAPGAHRMFMKPFEPIISRSGRLIAIRKLAYSAYTLGPATRTS